MIELVEATCEGCESETDHCQECGNYVPAEGTQYCVLCCDHTFDPADPSVGIFHVCCVHCGSTLDDLVDYHESHIDDFLVEFEDQYGRDQIAFKAHPAIVEEMNWRNQMAAMEAEQEAAEAEWEEQIRQAQEEEDYVMGDFYD